MNKRIPSILLAGIMVFSVPNMNFAQEQDSAPPLKNITPGSHIKKLYKHYPRHKARTYREEGNQEWITYNYPPSQPSRDTVTFYLQDDKIIQWKINDRREVIKEYLSEFASGGLPVRYEKIYTAIQNALSKLPQDVFLSVTDRSRPILFLDFYTSGIARFAGSTEFSVLPDDPATFGQGFYMIKLGDELNSINDVQAIEGVILHEIAHRVLEHLKKQGFSCEMEKEANQLVKSWGFEEEYKKASHQFGSKEPGDSPCHEK